MTQRISIYARYSSDLQSDASIEDQIRLCSERADSENWKVVNCYTDAGISGASLMRPGIQSLLSAAMNGEFDILLAEALDRLSRDQEDIAGIFKRMEFAGVKIITLSEGEISSLHIGLKGTMNAMFLKDLADKTRRGLRGRVENGKSGGGLAFGYQVVKQFNAQGEAIRGDRTIDEDQAEIVRRIFHEYAHENRSPKAIASGLNEDGIPCPSGKAWGQSTINGNRKRGTGILNNHLYIGELIWNRQRFIKDPATGRRVPRFNAESEWIRQSVPDLRIVPQPLWEAAKARQKELDKRSGNLGSRKRPQYLLSGLLVCGNCGGGFSKINSERYGCSSARNKGESVCTNKKTIKRDLLEGKVLNALQSHLMRDELVQVFCEEYARHMNALRAAQNAALASRKTEAAKLAKEKENIIQAIKDGFPASMVKDELERVAKRQDELAALMDSQDEEPRPLIHSTMSRRYRSEISALTSALTNGGAAEAREEVRGLIEKIVLTPKDGEDQLSIDLHGDLAGILRIAAEDKSMKDKGKIEKRLEVMAVNDNDSFEPSIQLVAGAGFEPTTFGL
ncbi:MAG: resolvase [Oleiphilus sp.]|nr:MAG: resolvase [Oleiphilus sp.]